MSSSLSMIPVHRRRHVAATLGLFAMLFVAVGAVAATGSPSGATTAFVVIALVVALLLALLGWGVVHSVRVDLADRRLDEAIEAAILAQGSTLRDVTCGCGHDHDPSELHVTDDPCGRDGGGHECSRTCQSCVFRRESATATAERVRPAPRSTAVPRRPMPSRVE